MPRQEWYKESDKTLKEKLPIPNKIKINLLLKSFSFETQNATFDNYERKTSNLNTIFNYMEMFALKIITKTSEYGPIGIILSGTPGIGKTHLSVSVAKYVSNFGKKVTFVDEEYIGSMVTTKGIPNFLPLINDSDLIILDDINSEYGASPIFLRQVLEYVIINNKALLYTSNNIIPVIQKNLPILFGYDHPFAKNFIAINNIIEDSFRKPWTNIDLKTISNISKYNLLNSYLGGQGAGIIIETEDIDEYKYIEEFNNITGNKLPIRIVRDWDEEQSLSAFKEYGKVRNLTHVHRQMYKGDVTDLEKYKIIIISIFNYYSVEQLIRILPKIHDNGIKVIILVKSYDEFKKIIGNILDKYNYVKLKPKITDRLNIIFPNIF